VCAIDKENGIAVVERERKRKRKREKERKRDFFFPIACWLFIFFLSTYKKKNSFLFQCQRSRQGLRVKNREKLSGGFGFALRRWVEVF